MPDIDTENRKHTLAAAKICWTAADISGPIPSPGINVTICVYHSVQYKTYEYWQKEANMQTACCP